MNDILSWTSTIFTPAFAVVGDGSAYKFGWIVVCLATIVGAIGAACLVGALGGRDFDLSWSDRIRYAIVGGGLCVIAAWLVIHVAAPIVDS